MHGRCSYYYLVAAALLLIVTAFPSLCYAKPNMHCPGGVCIEPDKGLSKSASSLARDIYIYDATSAAYHGNPSSLYCSDQRLVEYNGGSDVVSVKFRSGDGQNDWGHNLLEDAERFYGSDFLPIDGWHAESVEVPGCEIDVQAKIAFEKKEKTQTKYLYTTQNICNNQSIKFHVFRNLIRSDEFSCKADPAEEPPNITRSEPGRISSGRIVLPATIEEAKGGVPRCGNPFKPTTADRVVDVAGTIIDKAVEEYIAVPIGTALVQNSEIRNWMKRAFGVNNGKSVCANLCVAYPKNSRVEWVVTATDFQRVSELRETNGGAGREFGIGWARLDAVTHANSHDGTVTCAQVKHWRYDAQRAFQLHVFFRR